MTCARAEIMHVVVRALLSPCVRPFICEIYTRWKVNRCGACFFWGVGGGDFYLFVCLLLTCVTDFTFVSFVHD